MSDHCLSQCLASSWCSNPRGVSAHRDFRILWYVGVDKRWWDTLEWSWTWRLVTYLISSFAVNPKPTTDPEWAAPLICKENVGQSQCCREGGQELHLDARWFQVAPVIVLFPNADLLEPPSDRVTAFFYDLPFNKWRSNPCSTLELKFYKLVHLYCIYFYGKTWQFFHLQFNKRSLFK